MGITIRKRHNKDGSVTKTTSISRKGLFGIRHVDTYSSRTGGTKRYSSSINRQSSLHTYKTPTKSQRIAQIKRKYKIDNPVIKFFCIAALIIFAFYVLICIAVCETGQIYKGVLFLLPGIIIEIIDRSIRHIIVKKKIEELEPRRKDNTGRNDKKYMGNLLFSKTNGNNNLEANYNTSTEVDNVDNIEYPFQKTNQRVVNNATGNRSNVTEYVVPQNSFLELPKQDDIIERAILCAAETCESGISVSYIQRKMVLEYRRAASLAERLYNIGVIGPSEGARPRKVLINKEDYEKRAKILGIDASNLNENNTMQIEDDEKESLSQLISQLDSLTGLQLVKQEVKLLINLIRVQKEREKQGLKVIPISKHLVFTGNPGTGKTTVARLLAKIYKELGIVTKGQLIEVDRSKLVSGYVGQTALQTQKIIDSAMGGVLFIDEAYTLSGKGDNDFGQEAIDTLLKAMEDKRDDFIVIVAGYPDLMQKFLESNPGLISRFNRFIQFEDYKPNELAKIFMNMCTESGYTLTDDAASYIRKYMKDVYDNDSKNFANARGVRNVFEKAVVNQANRLSEINDFNVDSLKLISLEDLVNIS